MKLFCADLCKINGSAFLTADLSGINAEMTFNGIVDGGKRKGRNTCAEVVNEVTHDLIVAAAVLTKLTADGGVNDLGIKAVTLALTGEHTDLKFIVF